MLLQRVICVEQHDLTYMYVHDKAMTGHLHKHMRMKSEKSTMWGNEWPNMHLLIVLLESVVPSNKWMWIVVHLTEHTTKITKVIVNALKNFFALIYSNQYSIYSSLPNQLECTLI